MTDNAKSSYLSFDGNELDFECLDPFKNALRIYVHNSQVRQSINQ